MQKFNAILEIIGVNPFVFVPIKILDEIFSVAGKDKGKIPVCGTVNGRKYTQTLIKYSGEWRLYINTTMLRDSPKKIGESIEVEIEFDPKDRTIQSHFKLTKALEENKEAQKIFDGLSPSKQKEIVRYISFLKSDESIARNVEKAIGFLLGKNRFIGRDKPL
ncbi:YdeI/OmpD-associated family protein [Arenibacter sp. M-2]|uniref:YdeI/OmpD-associated family protein n=1 Tax=Arenibacter sp. M-2 TaxID=3053612 RepID=UPI00256FB81D|nr:YdeI/OmpD-associated family protein [Arenibacter sp. M-2]MDL5511136.1 YdeI/OmpD-associated family protein [Arenibacter sp. M-2]